MEKNKFGKISIANDVICMLIAKTAEEVDGVKSVKGYKKGKLERKYKKYLETKVDGRSILTSIQIEADNERSYEETARDVQMSVKDKLFNLLGLNVEEINIKFI